MTRPRTVEELAEDMALLGTLKGIERTRLADALAVEAPQVLMAEGDRGVWEATRPGRQPLREGGGVRKQVAEALAISVSYVQRRASRHATGNY
jgi:hypothetical protein